MSLVARPRETIRDAPTGLPAALACEVGYHGHDGRRADIWAAGVSLWAFRSGKLPFFHKAAALRDVHHFQFVTTFLGSPDLPSRNFKGHGPISAPAFKALTSFSG